MRREKLDDVSFVAAWFPRVRVYLRTSLARVLLSGPSPSNGSASVITADNYVMRRIILKRKTDHGLPDLSKPVTAGHTMNGP